MKNSEILAECDNLYLQIKNAEERLKEIREICKHEDTFEGIYSYRIGSIMNAEICSFCHKVIKPLEL